VTDLLATPLDEPPPADLPALLALLPQADLYLQDEVQIAFHPTLTRVWSRRGRRGQRRVAAPGVNEKAYGFGLLDWRDGWFDGRIGPQRTAVLFCEQLQAAVARSKARGHIALVIADNLRTHTVAGSRRVRELVAAEQEHLVLVYTPAYDPDANRIEWLWRTVRKAVTLNHRRETFALLRGDLEAEFERFRREPAAVLAHIGSPGSAHPPPQEFAFAA
jgi:transposase